jgi:thiamine-phosphate pyrophosphorylase
MKPLPRLYTIADSTFGDPVQLAAELFHAGARCVQIRNKNGNARELLAQTDRILSSAPQDALVIVNDRVDVAALTTSAGVHLGQSDLPPVEARRILGPGRTVGFSTHNLKQALLADALPVDYIAVGPVFTTTTKKDPDPVLGLEALAAICRAVKKPVVAIGGITLENAREVFQAGASSIAVIRDLLAAADMEQRVRSWMALCRGGL